MRNKIVGTAIQVVSLPVILVGYAHGATGADRGDGWLGWLVMGAGFVLLLVGGRLWRRS